jgi:hypothetical protein
MRKFNFIVYLILFVTLLSLMGMVNAVIADFNPGTLRQGQFWLLTVTTTLSYFSAFVLSTLSLRDYMLLKNETFLTMDNEINNIKSTGVDSDFPEYIHDFNKQNKIQSHVEITRNKLSKHTYKIPNIVVDELKLSEDKQSNKTKKWFKKKSDLLEMLTKEWIDENIDYHRVVYPRVTPTEVLTGVEQIESRKKLIEERIGWQIFKDRALYIIVNIVSNAFFASLILTPDTWTVEHTTRLLIQIVGLLINISTGIAYGAQLFKKIDINNAQQRKIILIKYLNKKGTT